MNCFNIGKLAPQIMKSVLIILVYFAFVTTAMANYPEDKIKSYDIKMTFDSTSAKIIVRNTLLVRKPFNQNFLFSRDIIIDSILAGKYRLKFHRQGDSLILDSKIANDRMTFYYTFAVDSFLYDKVILLTRGMKWCPYVHDNISDLYAEVTVPKGYNVFGSSGMTNVDSSGTRVIYRFKNKINSGLGFVIVPVGYYTERTETAQKFRIKYLFRNHDSSLQDEIIHESLAAFSFCNDYIGRYKRNCLLYIEVPGFGAAQCLESMILMGSDFINYYKIYPQMRSWVAHETIHLWIGTGYYNAIFDGGKYGVLMEESLTEYLRFQYIADVAGSDSVATLLQDYSNIYNNEIKGTDQDLPLSSNKPTRVAYCTGPLLFHELKSETGEEKWHKFIRRLYSNNYGHVIDYLVFKKTLAEFCSEKIITQMEFHADQKGIP